MSSFALVCTTAISVYSGLAYYGYPSGVYSGGGYLTAGCDISGLLFCVMGYRI